MKFLVLACRAGIVHRHECSVSGAAAAARIYRQWGWAVTVLPPATG